MSLQEAGAFAAVPHCDSEVMVSYDMLDLSADTAPPFEQPYVRIGEAIRSAYRCTPLAFVLDDTRRLRQLR